MSLGNNIKRIRKSRGFTQKELAEKLKVNINTIQNYENGRREPKSEIIKKLAKILDSSIANFYLDDNPKKEEENLIKIINNIPGSDKDLINLSPSSINYNNETYKAIDILNNFLKSDLLQNDCGYEYNSVIFKYGIEDIYIFIQEMLKLKFSNRENEDIAIELLLRSLGSSISKFSKDENKIIKKTINNYIDGMIEFKRMNK